MKETTLLKIALICSLVGLIVLYFISAKIEIRDYKPNILNGNIGDDVKLTGAIAKISDKGDVAFVEIVQKVPVSVVIFKDKNNLKLKSNDSIELYGKIQEYNGKNEIIAQRIRIVK